MIAVALPFFLKFLFDLERNWTIIRYTRQIMKNCIRIPGKLPIFILLFLSVLSLVYTQDNRRVQNVAILQKKPASADAESLELLRQARISFMLPLRILGDISMAETDTLSPELDEEALLALAAERNVDTAILIGVEKDDPSSFSVRIQVYDARGGDELYSAEAVGDSLREVLETTNQRIQEGITELLPATPDFGTITADTSSSEELLRYYIDGIAGGGGTYRRTLIPAGIRAVEITQVRPFGEVSVYKGTVDVPGNDNVAVSLSIPEITETEEAGFASLEEGLKTAWRKGDRETTEMQFGMVFALLGTAMPSETIASREDVYREWYSYFQNGEVPEGLKTQFSEAAEEEKQEAALQEDPLLVQLDPESQWKMHAGQSITMGAGALLSFAGSAASVISVEKRMAAEEAYADYLAAGANLETFFTDYSNLHTQYQAGAITAYSGWGSGLLSLSSSMIFFPADSLALSPAGKLVGTAALVLGIGGSLLHHTANIQTVENIDLYEAYFSASENHDSLFLEYSRGLGRYRFGRIGGLILWGTSAAALTTSLFIPGVREPVLSSWLDRLLITAGVVLITGGNLSSSFAHSYFMQAAEKYREYSAAGSNFDQLFTSYQGLLKNYQLTSLLAYGGWTLGTAAIITALYVPFRGRSTPRPQKNRAELLCFPSPMGIQFSMRM